MANLGYCWLLGLSALIRKLFFGDNLEITRYYMADESVNIDLQEG